MIMTEVVPFFPNSDRADQILIPPMGGGAANQSAVPVPVDSKIQIDRTLIQLGQLIGTGHFGIVYKAEMDMGDGKYQPIAVKTLKNEFNLDDNTKVCA